MAGVIVLLVSLAMALMPAFWPKVTVRDILAIDKWLHGMAFALLALWFSGQYRPRSYVRLAIGLLAFGALIEACQYLTWYRTAEWEDLYADAIGIVAGLAIALLGPGGWSMRVERWLLQRQE
jgi:VanZ family protein